jgi:hypothetical protein
MIISHKYKFIFIKTAKVAGTSVELHMSQHLGKNDVFAPFTSPEAIQKPQNYKGAFNPFCEIFERFKIDKNPKISGIPITFNNLFRLEKYFEPMPAWQVKSRVSNKIWNNYFKFTIERNPYDKVVSRYFHSKAIYEPKYGKELTIDGWLDYVEYNIKNPWKNMAWGAVAPYNFPRYAHPKSNEILVDKICRYENLLDELQEVFNQLSIPFNGTLSYRAKGHFRKDRRHYKDILTTDQRIRVERIFKKEFDLMKYEW